MTITSTITIPIWLPSKYYGEADGTVKGKRYVDFEPGYTVLIGPNGSGKSTYIKQIQYDFCREHEYPVIKFGGRDEHDRFSRSASLMNGDFEFLAGSMLSSEGENIMLRTSRLASYVGSQMRELRSKLYKGPVFILLDSIDSGMSMDKLFVFRRDFIDFIILMEKQLGNDQLYIINAANDWELIREADQINVLTGKHMNIKTYESYRNFVFKNSKEDIPNGQWKKRFSEIQRDESCSSACDNGTEDQKCSHSIKKRRN